MTHADLAKIWTHVAPVWALFRQLFKDHHFITIVCGFFVVMMVVSFYRFIRNISPALVPIVLLLVVFILVLHWTQTRTEPVVLKPAVDWFVHTIPLPAGR
jgi:hypothetical protein